MEIGSEAGTREGPYSCSEARKSSLFSVIRPDGVYVVLLEELLESLDLGPVSGSTLRCLRCGPGEVIIE